MKIRFILGIIFSTFLAAQLKAMQLYSFTGLPNGSYQQSCRNIKVRLEGDGLNLVRVIMAECKDAQGEWKKTTIKVPVLAPQESVLENNNGRLEIVEQSSQGQRLNTVEHSSAGQRLNTVEHSSAGQRLNTVEGVVGHGN